MNIFLVERAEQVEDFESGFDPDHDEWLALGPSAMYALDKRETRFKTPEDFCDWLDVERECLSGYEKLTRLCRSLDQDLLARDSFLAEWNIRPFLFCLWHLSKLVDGLLGRACQLERIFEQNPKAGFQIHHAPLSDWNIESLGYGRDDVLWGVAASLSGWEADINLHPDPRLENRTLKAGKIASKKGLSKHWAGTMVRKSVSLYSLAQAWRSGLRKNIFNISSRNILGRDRSLACLGGTYEWGGVLGSLIAEGWAVFYLNGKNLGSKNPETSWRGDKKGASTEAGRLLADKFLENGLQRLTPIADRFVQIASAAPLIARETVPRIVKLINRFGIRGLLISASSEFNDYLTKQVCRKACVPVLSWQHGSVWFDRAITQRNDVLNLVCSDKMFVYGDEVAKAYKISPLADDENCEVVSVGMPSALRLSEIKPAEKKAQRRLLWVFNGYYGNGWYCGFSPPYNDRTLYLNQKVIIESLLRFHDRNPNVSIIMKLFPDLSPDANPGWIKDLPRSERIKIIFNEKSFVDLLSDCEAVLIDCPTTTLLQAANTSLPLFVLMSTLQWPDAAVAMLKKRAVVENGPQMLMDKLSAYFQNGTYDPDPDDRTFTEAYARVYPGIEADAARLLREAVEATRPKVG